ncbi:hypothetical protein CHLRE_11g467582v5 [Chlamydomonas reinhardtii]|uniref:Uncharacterized protein n=1 Tax=Chlamydomonas reinhardtii TaxID=3055 RepID=A0A2K3D7C7_CHLRE|nr:uncharacterized protein CHLRE_11g467582v5 [Chlamydomonas reinhardtii]6U42_7Q Chain 7Q, RIB21 [Chlamydomonas reinhardtii]8GLV_7Q Chain 7Q, FAP306 [Chlamydomonas reinhardtii]8GLV_Hw Chain Hw, FAP306 [Chlamydomonas reinhardtii]8GLV_PW Chain PW, FAP306 [Chlamydomonas reinhardtii]8GLV_zn Chain zn, FAP306 [Chlamydomonas reinhardtii]8GLV_zo Chain zo, FAP306 [Chlamydomonas reinhardtii]PNW76434.1 hypothetical protein CHLRE_11g467582v5 [Chlamydomonas reinhardtii]
MDATTKTLKSTTRVDNSTNPNFKHTSTFHTRGQWTPESPPPLTSTYTIFHGERPELPRYVPKYAVSPETAALTSRHGSSPYSFRATAERAGSTPDGRATYRFSGLPAGVSPYSTGTKLSSSTLGSSGLPPVQYKSYLTEYVDEYREPLEQLDTQRSLTLKYGTTGGYRTTQRSTRSDGQPKYQTRVVAF